MKNYKYIIALLISCLFILPFNKVQAQKCAKKNYCSKENLGDYDYRSQSHYGQLSSGESQKVEIVVYANQAYRFLVCPDPKIGTVEYKIFSLKKRPKKVVQDIYEKEVNVYKQALNGEFEYDENGNKILLGTKVINDTIWRRKTVEEEKLIFDSQNNEFKPPYWETKTTKTGMLVIETMVEDSDEPKMGCVNVLVGRKTYKVKNK
ncbi:MAG: hypothetical protein GXO79_07545 [Chlorobi bacterium]|nr:hypothetical protein [Chlorobiota bacterium]